MSEPYLTYEPEVYYDKTNGGWCVDALMDGDTRIVFDRAESCWFFWEFAPECCFYATREEAEEALALVLLGTGFDDN